MLTHIVIHDETRRSRERYLAQTTFPVDLCDKTPGFIKCVQIVVDNFLLSLFMQATK